MRALGQCRLATVEFNAGQGKSRHLTESWKAHASRGWHLLNTHLHSPDGHFLILTMFGGVRYVCCAEFAAGTAHDVHYGRTCLQDCAPCALGQASDERFKSTKLFVVRHL
jgi:hypothetical protein